MNRIDIKPVSINQAYRGRRFKTKMLKDYKTDLLLLLPRKLKVPDGKLEVFYTFGLSNKGADYDNLIKNFQDILQEAYNFNDNKIYRATINKCDVKKGEEFISFKIIPYEESH